VVAANGRLDQTEAIAIVAAANERQQAVTRVHERRSRIVHERRTSNGPRADLPRDRRADHRAQFILIH
jgi:hypothetical protein